MVREKIFLGILMENFLNKRLRAEAMRKIQYLDFDSKIFGLKMGKILVPNGGLKTEELYEILQTAIREKYDHLFVRVNTQDTETLFALLKCGFYITDCLVTFSLDLQGYIPRSVKEVTIYERIDDEKKVSQIKEISKSSFKYDRFHSDPNLPKEKSDELNSVWAENDVRGRSLVTLLKERGNSILGFVTINKKDDHHAYIDLIAVRENCRGQGIGSALVDASLNWLKEQGFKTVTVGTQIANVPAIRLYERRGFLLTHSQYSFHKFLKNAREK